ncbi:MAG TPA: VWA domain-containing protein [Thermoanaerobaculia bacterium]|nr:VWA domain-containing protein [Thermoanaerobaculia bacterium]
MVPTLPLILAATVAWSPLPDALDRAKAEGKLVILHLRIPSEKANAEGDAKLARAIENENLALMLQPFVLARKQGRLPTVTAQPPLLVAMDPDGRVIQWTRINSDQEIGTMLGVVREHAPELLRSWEMRKTETRAAADVAFGRTLVRMGAGMRAAKLLADAADGLRREGKQELALHAEMWIGVAQFGAGFNPSGRSTVTKIANDRNAPPAVVAEAYSILGDFAVAERQRLQAVTYYRKAYELAPAGSPLLRHVRRELETYDRRPLPPKGEERFAAVRLITPARRTMTGRMDVVVEADPGVASVQLFVDDAPVATDDSRPFRLTVDVGPVAMLRTLKAVGYNDSDEAIGEDVATINDRIDAFRVAITSPAEQFVRGPSSIAVDVHVPETRKLERVELYWKERLVATLDGPPFRAPFTFPDEFGYVRAVGVLDDGTTVEEARLVNAGGTSASVDVRAVTLYATVTDAAGNRVEGLRAEDFVVEDEGTAVPVNVIRATDTPVTIGIAIDSSGSMKQWIFQALELANGFVRSGEGSPDRTFVTAFDNTPRLVHEASSDAASLRERILGITVAGGTSIFDGVIFTLQQFQEVPGRKALLLISDGREGFSSQSSAAAIRTARAAAIPIYTLSQRSAASLAALSEATGGASFHGVREAERQAVFTRIRDDVRGQYLITFQPRPGKAGGWRKLAVRTKRGELKVRTVSGYYAR